MLEIHNCGACTFLQGGDIEKATDWIFNNPNASASSDMDTTTSSNSLPTPVDAGLPDGGGSESLESCYSVYMLCRCP